MAKKIYIGTMIEDLKTKIDSMVTTLNAHTTALGNINTAVAQQINKGNIIPSDTVAMALTHAEISAPNSTPIEIARFKIYADGKLRIKLFGKSNNGAGAISTSIDGGTTKVVLISTLTNGSYTAKSADMNVTYLQEVIFYINGTSGGTAALQANSFSVCYDLVDLINNGYIIKV